MWQKIKSFFKGFVSNAVSRFKKLMAKAFPLARKIIVSALVDIGKEIVLNLNYNTLTDDQKRQEAFNQIKSKAKLEGIEAKDLMIHAAIDLILLELKPEDWEPVHV